MEPVEPTAVMEVDGGLRLRLGVDLLVELSVLRLRIASAFAAKVRTHGRCCPTTDQMQVGRACRHECRCFCCVTLSIYVCDMSHRHMT